MSDKNIFIKIDPVIQPRMTIHSDGKAFFNKEATKLMALSSNSYFKIAKGKNQKCIFLFPVNKCDDTLKCSRAGLYFYLNAVSLFKRLGFKRKESYDVTTAVYEGETIFKITL